MNQYLLLLAFFAAISVASANTLLVGWDFANLNPSLSVGNIPADKSSSLINAFAAETSDYILYTNDSRYSRSSMSPFPIDGGQQGFLQTQDSSGGTQSSIFNAQQVVADSGQTVGGAPLVGRTAQFSFDTTTGLNFRGDINNSFFSIFVEGTEFASWELTYSRTFLNGDYDEVNNWGWWTAASDAAGNNDGIIDPAEVTNFATDDLSALTEDTYAQTTITIPTSLNFQDYFLVYTFSSTETETFNLQNQGVAFDNIAICGVPEPASVMCLFGLAAGLLAHRHRV